ncbi:MAG TPA: PKD domain-containing protein [Thermoleophilia bacterium]|nr:PKD domain-containing protein [Thermoleophilia bacterium]
MTRFTVSCRNAPPRVAAIRRAAVRRGATVRRLVTFTDPGADTWRARITWGDGSGRHRRYLGHAHRFAIHHAFRRTGSFTVTVKVYDQHGAYGLRRFRVTVRP